MNLSFSWFVRKASNTPLMPSPGKPKIVSTPHPIRRSTNKSAVVLAIYITYEFLSLRCSLLEYESEKAQCSARQRRCSFVFREPCRRGFFMSLLPEYAAGAEVSGHGLEEIIRPSLRDGFLCLL